MKMKTADELREKYGRAPAKDHGPRMTIGDFAERLRKMGTSERFDYLHWLLLAFISPEHKSENGWGIHTLPRKELFYLVCDLNGLLRAWERTPPNVAVEIRGRGLEGCLTDAQIDEETRYGGRSGKPIEVVIQDMVADWAPGPVTMEVEGTTGFFVQEFCQQKNSLLAAIDKLAGLIGLHMTYIFEGEVDPGAFKILLFEAEPLLGPKSA